MNYRLKKEYIGKPTGVSDVGIIMEDNPFSNKYLFATTEPWKQITFPKIETENWKIDKSSRKSLQLKNKLNLCIDAMQTVIDNTDEFATKELLMNILDKVKEVK